MSKRLEATCDYVNVMNAVMDEAKRMEQEWQDAHDAEIARVDRAHAKLKDAVATKKTTCANLLDAPGPSTAVRVANEWGKSVYEKHKDTEDTGDLFANLAKRVLDMKVELIGKEEEAHKAYVMSPPRIRRGKVGAVPAPSTQRKRFSRDLVSDSSSFHRKDVASARMKCLFSLTGKPYP